MEFQEARGIAYCGLACVLCSEADCPGCANLTGEEGRAKHCAIRKCAASKSAGGCYACADNPCGENMLEGKRARAFNRYMRDFGKQALIDRLRINCENGITYHAPGKTSGDYDALETETEIYQLVRYGRKTPYEECPAFETGHLKIRLVRESDAEELLSAFKNDLSSWTFWGDERYATLEELQQCIRAWHNEYTNKCFIRFSVIDIATEKVFATIELFDNVRKGHEQEHLRRSAALHIDLPAAYETKRYYLEILTLANEEFAPIFGFNRLMVRVRPNALERISALEAIGYRPSGEEPWWEYDCDFVN